VGWSCRRRGDGGCWSPVAGRSCCLSLGHFLSVRRTRRHCPICPVDAICAWRLICLGTKHHRTDSTPSVYALPTSAAWYPLAVVCPQMRCPRRATCRGTAAATPKEFAGYCARTLRRVLSDWPHALPLTSAAMLAHRRAGIGASETTTTPSVHGCLSVQPHWRTCLAPLTWRFAFCNRENEYATAMHVRTAAARTLSAPAAPQDVSPTQKPSSMHLPAIPTHRTHTRTSSRMNSSKRNGL
jgi:hypothetical protein